MTRPLGRNQYALLNTLSGVGLFMIVGNREARSLARRGFLRARGKDGKTFYQITPAGLRRVADDLDSGAMPLPEPSHCRHHGPGGEEEG